MKKNIYFLTLLSITAFALGSAKDTLIIKINENNLDPKKAYAVRTAADNQYLTPSDKQLDNENRALIGQNRSLYYPIDYSKVNSLTISLWQMPQIITTSSRPEAMSTTKEVGETIRLAGLQLKDLVKIKAIAKKGNSPKLEITYDPQNQNKARVNIGEEVNQLGLDLDIDNENKNN